jgi:Protein of unknown function (DUF935)
VRLNNNEKYPPLWTQGAVNAAEKLERFSEPTLLTRITNRIFKRNGHAPEYFSQASAINLADDTPGEPTLDKEFAAFVSKGTFSMLGLPNEMPVLSSKGMGIVDAMMCDDMVGTCIELKKTAALSVPPKWEPASDDPEHKKHADYLNEVLAQLDSGEQDADGVNIGLVNKLRDMLSAIEYGYSVTNVLYTTIDTGAFKGKIGIGDMKTKPPHNISFDVDEFLNIKPDGILYAVQAGNPEKLPLAQFLVYSYRAKFANPYGYSDCIRAYDRWNSKRWVQKMWDIYLERHGCGTWVATYDKLNPPPANERAAVLSFLDGAQARSALYMSDRITMVPHEPTPGASSTWSEAIAARNQQIARALFNPDLTGFSAKDAGGSYSLGKKQFDMYLMIISSLQADISAVMKPLGRKLVTMSYGVQDQYPKLVFPPLTDETKVWFLSAVGAAVKDGVLVPDQAVVDRVREVLELPEAEPGAVPMQPQPGMDPNNPNDPNAPEPDNQDAPEEVNPEDGKFAAPDPKAVIDAALAVIGKNERTVIVAGPKAGKSTVATLAGERFKTRVRYADNLIGQMDWSAMSATVADWLDAPGKWVVEGVASVRAIRKWLAANPDKVPPFAVVVMSNAIQQRSPSSRPEAQRLWCCEHVQR